MRWGQVVNHEKEFELWKKILRDTSFLGNFTSLLITLYLFLGIIYHYGCMWRSDGSRNNCHLYSP